MNSTFTSTEIFNFLASSTQDMIPPFIDAMAFPQLKKFYPTQNTAFNTNLAYASYSQPSTQPTLAIFNQQPASEPLSSTYSIPSYFSDQQFALDPAYPYYNYDLSLTPISEMNQSFNNSLYDISGAISAESKPKPKKDQQPTRKNKKRVPNDYLVSVDMGDGTFETIVKRRYKCTFDGCEKTFSTSGHVARHERVHKQQGDFCCEYQGCHARFSRPDNKNTHHKVLISNLVACQERTCFEESRG